MNKFIFLDNNLNNTEKLSDVLGDYKKSGLVDIYDLFGSKIGQSEFFEIVYEKYKNKCSDFYFLISMNIWKCILKIIKVSF